MPGLIELCTPQTGIAHMADMARIGRVAIKAIVYFEVMTTIALIIGLLAVNIMQPGAGMSVDVPELRIKAAQAAAPYVHAKPGRSKATDSVVRAKHIEGVCEFIIEPEVARILRDNMERLSRLDVPLSSAEEQEKSELRARIAETARKTSCPANYGRKEAEQDRKRLQTIFAKRRSGALGGVKSEAEIAEEAQLAARVAAFDEGPEPRARGRILELALASFSGGLSDAESEELQRLQKAYPPDPDPLTDAIKAYRRAAANDGNGIERSGRTSKG